MGKDSVEVTKYNLKPRVSKALSVKGRRNGLSMVGDSASEQDAMLSTLCIWRPITIYCSIKRSQKRQGTRVELKEKHYIQSS